MPSKLNCGVQYITSSHHHNDLTLMDYATIVLPILRCHAWTCRNNSELRVYKAWLDVRTVLCKLLMLSTQSRDSKYIYSMCNPTCSTTQQNTNRCFIYIYIERERERESRKRTGCTTTEVCRRCTSVQTRFFWRRHREQKERVGVERYAIPTHPGIWAHEYRGLCSASQ